MSRIYCFGLTDSTKAGLTVKIIIMLDLKRIEREQPYHMLDLKGLDSEQPNHMLDLKSESEQAKSDLGCFGTELLLESIFQCI